MLDIELNHASPTLNYGEILSVRGSIVDVFFKNNLPLLYAIFHTGKENQVYIEVLTQLNEHSIRGIALNPTEGLARGMIVQTDGKELMVPIGKNILGRMFDVFGHTTDKGEPLEMMEYRSIHQSPPPLNPFH